MDVPRRLTTDSNEIVLLKAIETDDCLLKAIETDITKRAICLSIKQKNMICFVVYYF